MCGRYNIVTDADALLEAFKILNDIDAGEPIVCFNIAPTQYVPVITKASGGRQLSRMRWGLIPDWNKDPSPKFTPHNARSETIWAKAFFKHLLNSKRCLIPASGFYEWQKSPNGKIPYNIRFKNKDLFAFAGLWDNWESPTGNLNSCTILTTEANTLMRPIHNRMPVILSPEDQQQWLDCDAFEKNEINSFLKPYNPDEMEAYVISSQVNNARNNSAELINKVS